MQFRTHLTTTLAVSLPVMTATDTLTVGTAAALCLGSLFPDIDEPHSWIGSRTRGFSDLINKLFGHRGLTHSVFGLLVVFLTMLLLVSIINFPSLIAVYFLLGYVLHLVEDSFSKSGIKWFLPFNSKNYKSGMGIVYYKTGGMAENIVLLVSVVFLIIQINGLGIGNLISKTMTMIGI